MAETDKGADNPGANIQAPAPEKKVEPPQAVSTPTPPSPPPPPPPPPPAPPAEKEPKAPPNPDNPPNPPAPKDKDPEQEKVERERELMLHGHEKKADSAAQGSDRPMPGYSDKDGKAVSALRIREIKPVGGKSSDSTLNFVEPGYGPVTVTAPWITENLPRPGGWYVVDADGRRFINAQDFAVRFIHKGTAA